MPIAVLTADCVPLLLFDNINSSDFPWSLFFFSLGFFLMRKEKYLYCCIFFALCVGCRYNFIIFVYAALFSHYFINSSKLSFEKFLFLSLLTLVIIFLIFFPINFLYSENTSLNFSSRVATPGDGYNLEALVPRFIYKNFKLFEIVDFKLKKLTIKIKTEFLIPKKVLKVKHFKSKKFQKIYKIDFNDKFVKLIKIFIENLKIS